MSPWNPRNHEWFRVTDSDRSRFTAIHFSVFDSPVGFPLAYARLVVDSLITVRSFGLDDLVAITGQLRPQIIDGDEQHVGSLSARFVGTQH